MEFEIAGIKYEAPNRAAAMKMHYERLAGVKPGGSNTTTSRPPLAKIVAVPQPLKPGPPQLPKTVTVQPPSNVALAQPPAATSSQQAPPQLPVDAVVSYRGARRSLEELPNGFELQVPLKQPEQSRDYILLYLGWTLKDFPHLGTMVKSGVLGVDQLVLDGKIATPLDLMRFVIGEKNAQRPTVSTDITPGCGGYAEKGYVHTIHGKGLKPVAWKSAVPKMQLKPIGLWPTLYLDTPTLATANHIAVRNKTGVQELAYFTNVPRDFIVFTVKSSTNAAAKK
jgi:hypothetical protein